MKMPDLHDQLTGNGDTAISFDGDDVRQTGIRLSVEAIASKPTIERWDFFFKAD